MHTRSKPLRTIHISISLGDFGSAGFVANNDLRVPFNVAHRDGINGRKLRLVDC